MHIGKLQTEARMPYHRWYYFVAVFGIMLIIVTKEIDFFLHPKFLVEDGAIFFSDAFNLAFSRSLILPYAGYYHLIPRLIGEASQWVPFVYSPIFFNSMALLISTFCLSWFVLPHFRHIVTSDFLRLVFVLLLPLLTNGGGFLIVAYLQWPLFVWCIFVSMMNFPVRKGLQVGIISLYLLTIPTVAIQLVLIPIWLVRLRFASLPFQKLWIHSLIIVQEIMVIYLLFAHPASTVIATSDNLEIAIDFLHSFLYKGLWVNFLGYNVTEFLFQEWGWSFFYASSLLLAGIVVIYIWNRRVHKIQVFVCLGLIYIAAAALLLFYITRAQEIHYNFIADPIRMAQQNSRYFWATSVSLLLIVFILADLYRKEESYRNLKQSLIAAAISCIFILQLSSTQITYWGDASWHIYSELLDYLSNRNLTHSPQLLSVSESRLDASSVKFRYHTFLPIIALQYSNAIPNDSLGLKIPIKPMGWSMNLYVQNYSSKIVSLREDITWLGYHQELKKQSVTVSLFWQGNRLADPVNNVYYTAYVHIVDSQQNRIAGTDVLLEPSLENADNNAIFFSTHEIQLPDQLPAGEYSLVIGLYYFDSANALVPGSSFIIENSIKIETIN